MFSETREFLDKWEELFNVAVETGRPLSPDEEAWLDIKAPFDCAKALYEELPDVVAVAKMILIMEEYKKR